jgi:hypothetical protein
MRRPSAAVFFGGQCRLSCAGFAGATMRRGLCVAWCGSRRRQSRRTPKVLGGLFGRTSTKPPTLLRDAEWGTLRGDLGAWQEDRIEERSFVAALLRMTANGGSCVGIESRQSRIVRSGFLAALGMTTRTESKDQRGSGHPALTGRAKLCRDSGAGFAGRDDAALFACEPGVLGGR